MLEELVIKLGEMPDPPGSKLVIIPLNEHIAISDALMLNDMEKVEGIYRNYLKRRDEGKGSVND